MVSLDTELHCPECGCAIMTDFEIHDYHCDNCGTNLEFDYSYDKEYNLVMWLTKIKGSK